jgi:antitoxin PrlF
MPKSTLTSKGQVTIPKAVRERLGVKVGDRLVFRFDRDGRLVVAPESPDRLGAVPGLLGHLARSSSVSLEEMDEAIRSHVTKKHARANRR